VAQAAQLAIIIEQKHKLAGVSKRMDRMETQQQAGAQTQLEQQAYDSCRPANAAGAGVAATAGKRGS